MQVLLLKDVDQVGRAGEVKRVADGYARNFLIPRGLATMASPGAIKKAELEREAATRRQAKELSEAQSLARALDGVTVSFQARAGEQDRLYGSITKADIAEQLEKKVGQEVDRRKIELDEPIKELGTHAITIHLAPDAEATVSVVVERVGEE
ncbi:MAG TPA: 50S ribosomal protein L9 [Anaerolineae bacterium]|nr:50S ribosomal protein L9 [Anaerolineae bacterium]